MVPQLEHETLDLLSVDERPIETPQIGEDQLPVFHLNRGMAARGLFVVDPQRAVRPPADDHKGFPVPVKTGSGVVPFDDGKTLHVMAF